MPVEHLPLLQPLGPGGDHVLLADLFEEGILGEQGHDRQAAHGGGGDGQDHVPEVVENLARPTELVPVVRDQAAQREHAPETAAAEQDDEDDAEHEARDGVTDQDDRTGGHVEGRAVTHRLGDAERNAHRVDDEKGPQAKRHGHRQLGDDQLGDAHVVVVGVAEIEHQVLAHHGEEAGERRLVETVELLQLLDPFLVQPLVALVEAAAGGVAASAVAAQLGHQPLHRPAGHELGDGKGDEHDAEQGRYHEQEPFEDIAAHASSVEPRAGTAWPDPGRVRRCGCHRRNPVRAAPGRPAAVAPDRAGAGVRLRRPSPSH